MAGLWAWLRNLLGGNKTATAAAGGLIGALGLITITATNVHTPPPKFPDATNTGVPDGVSLTTYTGPLTITDSGTTNISNVVMGSPSSPVEFHVAVSAGTVNLTNVRIYGLVTIFCTSPGSLTQGVGTPLVHCPSATPYLNMTDSEVIQGDHLDFDSGVAGENYHLNRVEISGGRRSFNCETDAWIEDSWMHGIAEPINGTAHESTGRMSQGCHFDHNTFECKVTDVPPDGGCSADMTGYGDFETVADNLIENNLFKATSGGFCAYGGSAPGKAYPNAHDIRFINNTFERTVASDHGTMECAYYGTAVDFNPAASGNVWSGNVFTDGTPVNPS